MAEQPGEESENITCMSRAFNSMDEARTSRGGDGTSRGGDGTSMGGDVTSMVGEGTSMDGDGTSMGGDGTSMGGDGTSMVGEGTSMVGEGTSMDGEGTCVCAVCDKSMDKPRVHYGGVCCYSCRAFFRSFYNSSFILDLSFLCVCFQTNIFYIHGSVSELSSIIK